MKTIWILSFSLLFFASGRKLCDLYSISHGKWVYQAGITKAFVCCDSKSDSSTFPCKPNSTSPITTDIGSRSFIRLGGHACQCDRLESTWYATTPREKWIWKPEHCQILAWNASYFCSLLGNRKILFIGDSTMYQTAGTLINMIINDNGSCASQIQVELFFGSVQIPFERILTHSGANFLITGSGPHYHDFNEYNQTVFNILSVLKRYHNPMNRNGIHIIWKSINFPHQHCEAHETPISHPLPFIFAEDRYNWKLFPLFDEIARYYTSLYQLPYIDMHPLKLRPDGHPKLQSSDCLHYCLPGPLNLFSTMMLHYLYHEEQRHKIG